MATNVIQGINAVLSFYNGSYLPFVCSSDVTLEINTDTQSVKTIGDGIWEKVRPVKTSYQISLSGVLKYTNTPFGGFDLIQNQIGWVDMQFLLSYTDDAGNIKSFSGYATIKTSSLGASIGQVVKNDFTMIGNGQLKFFDGLVPCPTSINSITVTNPTNSAGNIIFTYTYTGAVYQVKYRLDNAGAWGYALISGATFTINAVPVGDHTVEVVPICNNGYEGTSATQSFTATHLLTCALQITSITHSVSFSNVTWTLNFNADPSSGYIRYRIDGGSWIYPAPHAAGPMTVITPLSVGTHTFEAQPICANGAFGTGNTDTATVTSGSAISTINYAFTAIPGGAPGFQIYVAGLLIVDLHASASGSITANNGDSIKVLVQVNFAGRDMTLSVHDDSLSSYLYNHATFPTPGTLTTDTYTWTANGDTYTVQGVISP